MSKFTELRAQSDDELEQELTPEVEKSIRIGYDTAINQQSKARIALKREILDLERALAKGTGVGEIVDIAEKELELEEVDILIEKLEFKKKDFLED